MNRTELGQLSDPAAAALDDAALRRELAAGAAMVIRPALLLNSLAVCKMIYAEGRPVDWLHLYTNPAWEKQSGQGSAAGKYASELFPGIHALDPEILQIFHRVAAGGVPEKFTRFLRSIGQWFEVQAYCEQPGYFIAVFDIVTERLEREQALQVAQQRLALAQSVTKSGIWDWDIPSGTQFWTPEMYRLFGLDGTTTVVGFETWRTAVHPDDIADVENRTRRAIGRRQPMFSEFRIVLPDRSVRWIRAHGNALYDADGSPRRMLGLCLDVTDLKHLSASAADASAANPPKNMYLATMSHELRTPLNSILGFTSLLLDGVAGEINEEQARQLAIVKRSGQQLLELVAEILDFAKAEAGKLTLELVAVPLKRLLLEQHEALRPIAEARGIALDPPECDDDLVVRADAQRLSQVVRNLLANSAKFTDHGRISVKARLNDAFVRVEVEDTGIGIAADEIGGLFTPFRRSDDPRSASRGGTGLGLSISRSMVLAMGGEITVESVPGLGSTFSITLPAYAGLP